MIRWFLFLPYLELYMDENNNSILGKFLIKRSMYCLFNKRSFFLSRSTQITALAHKDKNKDDLLKKLKSKYRNEIRALDRRFKTEKILISEKKNLDNKLINFLLINYRGQKPNIKKLIKLCNSQNLINFIFTFEGLIICCQQWIRNGNRARLIYNIADYKLMKKFKINSANKFLMFQSIINLNNKNYKIIDLGGLSNKNNNIDKFKRQFSRKELISHNIIYF